MPLGANVPRRRPSADASSFISPPRTFPPTFKLHGDPKGKDKDKAKAKAKAKAKELCFPASLRSDRPAWPAGLRGQIKEEAFAAGGCRGTCAPKACRPRRARQVRRSAPSNKLLSRKELKQKRPAMRGVCFLRCGGAKNSALADRHVIARVVAGVDLPRAADLELRVFLLFEPVRDPAGRSEDGRVGIECVRTGRSGWSTYH